VRSKLQEEYVRANGLSPPSLCRVGYCLRRPRLRRLMVLGDWPLWLGRPLQRRRRGSRARWLPCLEQPSNNEDETGFIPGRPNSGGTTDRRGAQRPKRPHPRSKSHPPASNASTAPEFSPAILHRSCRARQGHSRRLLSARDRKSKQKISNARASWRATPTCRQGSGSP
jgi:hypothetical protein